MPGRDDGDAAASVRELDTWQPTPSGPPTARLKLDLGGMRGGVTGASSSAKKGAADKGVGASEGARGGVSKAKTSSLSGDAASGGTRPPRAPSAVSRPETDLPSAAVRSARAASRASGGAAGTSAGAVAGSHGLATGRSGVAASSSVRRRLVTSQSAPGLASSRRPSAASVGGAGAGYAPLASSRSKPTGVAVLDRERDRDRKARSDADGSMSTRSADSDDARRMPTVPRRYHSERFQSKDVILSNVKSEAQLTPEQMKAFDVQKRVLSRIHAAATDVNSESHFIVSLFRECNPDEFGLVNRSSFRKRIKDVFNLSSRDADLLFSLGDPQQKGELRYRNFRAAFSSLDQLPVDNDANVKRRSKHASKHLHSNVADIWNPVAKRLADMEQSEKMTYHDMSQVRHAIEKNKRHLRAHFLSADDEESGGRGKTRLSFTDACEALQRHGLKINETRLRQLFTPADADKEDRDGITFSQLCRRTDDYFADLTGLGPSNQTLRQRNQELKGRVLGCRKIGQGPASKLSVNPNPSEFLAHHDLPTIEEGALDGYTGRRKSLLTADGSEPINPYALLPSGPADPAEIASPTRVKQAEPHTSAEGLWKKKWEHKTLEKERKARPVRRDVEHLDGHGDILKWHSEGGVAQPRMHTGRRTLAVPGSSTGDHAADVLPSARLADMGRMVMRGPSATSARGGGGPADEHGDVVAPLASSRAPARRHRRGDETERSVLDTSRTEMTTARSHVTDAPYATD